LAVENVKASLEEMHKKGVWQREREEMQREVKRLREEAVAAVNGRASWVEMRKRREEETAVWQHEREEMLRQVKRLREEVMAA
jgi:HSP90 family molecular chaperone